MTAFTTPHAWMTRAALHARPQSHAAIKAVI
jgi:hypothetical protein